ncbi:MAG: hypothetical protein Q4D38_14975, partial [Planctomycetia bacterium]|nr:hypothetical protein [Planctomycetia bacterium]
VEEVCSQIENEEPFPTFGETFNSDQEKEMKRWEGVSPENFHRLADAIAALQKRRDMMPPSDIRSALSGELIQVPRDEQRKSNAKFFFNPENDLFSDATHAKHMMYVCAMLFLHVDEADLDLSGEWRKKHETVPLPEKKEMKEILNSQVEDVKEAEPFFAENKEVADELEQFLSALEAVYDDLDKNSETFVPIQNYKPPYAK